MPRKDIFSMNRHELQDALSESMDINYRYVEHTDKLMSKIDELVFENAKLLALCNEYKTENQQLKRTISDLISNATLGGVDEYEQLDFPKKPY